MEIQYMDFTCNNKSAFMKYHVVKKKKTLHARGHYHVLDHTAY